jgi:hypothetical protein
MSGGVGPFYNSAGRALQKLPLSSFAQFSDFA